MNWVESLPAFLSTIASIAAAIAAFISLRISKQSINTTKENALAEYHKAASIAYAESVEKLDAVMNPFYDVAQQMNGVWARELEELDNYNLGGVNPRPLRHVISNGSEMLAYYSSTMNFRRTQGIYSILSVMVSGMGNINDNEYHKLLKIADGSYTDFEHIFGKPSMAEPIASAQAFRWINYQMIKRVQPETWTNAWNDAWLDYGWVTKFLNEHSKVKSNLSVIHDSLKTEKNKLAHSLFPLEQNTKLHSKYTELLSIIESLINDCDLTRFETYKNCQTKEEHLLILCAMATAYLAIIQINKLSSIT